MIVPTILCGPEYIQNCVNMDHLLLRKTFRTRLPKFFIKAEVYFNWVKPHVELWLSKDTARLAVWRSTLNDSLPDIENRKVAKIEFHAYWVDIEIKVAKIQVHADWIDIDRKVKYDS